MRVKTNKISGLFRRIKRLNICSLPKLSVSEKKFLQENGTTDLILMNLKMLRLVVISFWKKHKLLSRLISIVMILVIIFSIFYPIYQEHIRVAEYNISKFGNLIPSPIKLYDSLVTSDSQSGGFQYNKDYQVGSDVSGDNYVPKFSAYFASSRKNNSVTVTDPVSKVDITLTPKFNLGEPMKDTNRVVYPLVGVNAVKVYSLGASSIKEDIIMYEKPGRDNLELSYAMNLQSGTEPRLEADGSIGIYGVENALLGNVTTASDADAQLLEKARQQGKKTEFLFRIPAPYVVELKKTAVSKNVKAWFTLNGTVLTLNVSGLKSANYPLSIDPTIYIESARKLMRGNNETNTDFDVSNDLIQKSQTTGARIDAWSSTSNLSSAVWGQGTAVAGGYIYSVGGVGSGTTTTTTYNTAGSNTYTVPTGITSLTIKAWGAGGGGGSGSGSTGVGGDGGGGGYAKAVISVTPGESLTVKVGTAGAKATANSRGGNGGGASSVQRSSTYLVEAAGGGGGGGRRGNTSGTEGHGGAGGGTTGEQGTAGSTGGPGLGGTQSAGGTGGTGTGGGATGASQAGGNGGTTAACATSVAGTGGAGGTGGGGSGGTFTSTCAAGGGGGGGYYGGGGGASTSTNNRSGGGGGGGSSYINPTGLVAGTDVNTSGTGVTPGNSGDSDRSGLGDGGTGATTFGNATAGDNGIVVISYTTPGSITNKVYWAQFNTTTNAIDSPNPGTGACSGWCNNTAYDLPVALTGLSLVAYNGFLYAIGGSNSSGTPQTSVYIAKIGANGEPQLWHPTGGTPGYWYSDTALSTARSYFGAVAYNNKMYILGGLSASTTVLSSNTVQMANINPMGTLTTWTTTGTYGLSTTASGNRYGLTAHIYNDTLYVIGGDATFSGTPVATVDYSKLNSDGTMNPWKATSSLLTSGRLTGGGVFSTIFGGYMYVNGGCTAVNASGYCTSIATDVQLASINADGSISEFNTILGLTNDRFAHTFIAWQGGLYRLGGCRSQDSSSGACTDTVLDVDYGVINVEGEASTVASSVPSGTAPCSGGSPYGCDLPGVATVGNILNNTVLQNGFLYIMGGCTVANCGSASNGIIYTSIGSDGSLTKPAACSGSYSASYCVNSTNLPTNMASSGTATFNGTIYLVGGWPSVNSVYYTTPAADGTISSWSSKTLGTIGATNVSYAFAYTRANPASAGTYPGNLYIFGGCTSNTTVSCTSMTQNVYKCNIDTSNVVVSSSCSTSGQTLIGTATDGAGNSASGTGLGAMAGAVYANYIYLIGGLAPGLSDLKTTRYAKFDNSNNVTAVSGTTFYESTSLTFYGRRRGAAYGYNGYLYIVGGYDGSSGGGGVLADIEFAKIDVTNGSIADFVVSSVSIQQRWGLSLAISNSYAYVIGGCISGNAPTSCVNPTGPTDNIQTFQIYNNESGAVNNATAGNTLGVDRVGGSATVMNGYIYYAGGCTDMACTTLSTNTYYAAIDAYGTVGSWSSGGALPAARAWGKLLNAGGTLYYVGGQTGAASTTAVSTVYYTSSLSSGNPTWAGSGATKGVGDTGSGAQARTQFGAAVWENRIYVTGGFNASGTAQTTVYVSPKLSSGGDIASNWQSTTAFNVARAGHTLVAYANNLYILGGYDGTNYLSDTQFATIGYKTGTISQSGTTVTGSGTSWTSSQVGSVVQYPDGSRATISSVASGTSMTVSASKTVTAGTIYTIQDGSAGSWTYSTSLTDPIKDADGFAANGYIYLVGGRTASTTCKPNVLIAPISANTIISDGNNPTGVGEWYETNVRYSGDRYGAAVVYNSGRMFLVAGGCSSFVSSGDRMYYSTLKSQPQVAKYSRMIDTDTDVFPTSWLMNGIDNSIGARWQVKYSSMHDLDTLVNPNEDCGTSSTMATMTTWGQETNFGDTYLGDVNVYTPKNSSGGNINCARYYYFSISIDASQTYGYPEDVNRGPTISDLSLFFTSDPSKRLRHGKTFTGGELQPLDTPCRQTVDTDCPLP